MLSKPVAGTEKGLKKAAKPKPSEDAWGWMGDNACFLVVGGSVKGMGEGGGDGMCVIGGVASFDGEWGTAVWGSGVMWEEESSSKPTTTTRLLVMPLDANLELSLGHQILLFHRHVYLLISWTLQISIEIAMKK